MPQLPGCSSPMRMGPVHSVDGCVGSTVQAARLPDKCWRALRRGRPPERRRGTYRREVRCWVLRERCSAGQTAPRLASRAREGDVY